MLIHVLDSENAYCIYERWNSKYVFSIYQLSKSVNHKYTSGNEEYG